MKRIVFDALEFIFWVAQLDWKGALVLMISALFGLVGVIFGGVLSFGIQWYFQKRNDEKELKSNLRVLQFHIMDSINDIGRINRHLDSSIPEGYGGEVWVVFQPLANMHEEVIAMEKSLLAPLCDGKTDDFLNDLLDFFSYRNSLITLVKEYNRRRTDINSLTAPFAQVERGRMEAELRINPAEHPEIIMQINEVDRLAQDVVSFAREGLPLMRGMAERFPPVARRIGGKDFKVSFVIEGQAQEQQAQG